MSKEEFERLWKDSTKEEILNQYYYDYIELMQRIKIMRRTREYLFNNALWDIYNKNVNDKLLEMLNDYE